MKKEQRIVILLLLLAVVVIALFAANALIPQQKRGKTQHIKNPTNTPTPVEEQVTTLQEKGMIVAVDTKQKEIVYRSFETGEELSLAYSTKTDITDKYGKVIVAGSLKFGDLVDVICDAETGKLEALFKSSDQTEPCLTCWFLP